METVPDIMTDLLKFITFEGGEGAGKSTQARLLADWLRGAGHEVVLTREPGGSPGAERIRTLILTADPQPEQRFDGLTEALLHAAARRDHCLKVVMPALDRGAFVISDRFSDSTIAYQGFGLGVPLETLTRLHDLAVPRCIRPSTTFLLELSPEDGLARARHRTSTSGPAIDRYEAEELEFHQRIGVGFNAIAEAEPNRVQRIDAGRCVDEAEESIRSIIRFRYQP